jgi:hypothetical protein
MEPETSGPPATNSIFVSGTKEMASSSAGGQQQSQFTTHSYPGCLHFSLLQIKGNQREIVPLVYFSSERSLFCGTAGFQERSRQAKGLFGVPPNPPQRA